MKATRGLSAAEAKQFLEKGYVILRGCFKKEAAAVWIDEAYRRMGCDPRDKKTWKPGDKRELKGTRGVLISDFAPRAWEAICDVVGGEERLRGGRMMQSWSDSFIVKFPGPKPPRSNPMLEPIHDMHWHKDGPDVQHLDGTDPGLLTYVIWSDLKAGGGGTMLAPESIAPVCRHWAAHPEGANKQELPVLPIIRSCREFVELTGKAGDVVLAHPAMIHAESDNVSGEPRFFTVRILELAEPMNFNRADKKDFSLLESVVLRSLGKERLDFKRK